MATIYEVAARAGVSVATVSRVFNGVSVSAEKSQRVRDAAHELRFTPNRAARSLRTQSSEIIALVIPDIENPFFTSMARGVEDVAQAAGYSVVLCNTDEDLVKEGRYLSIALSENMAGVVLAPASDQSDVSALVAKSRPIVAVDRRLVNIDVDAVTVDNSRGGRAATQALIDAGFSRIACITGPANVETSEQRSAGWRSALMDNGLQSTDQYLRHANFRVDGGRQAMSGLLAMPLPPDAVFVTNNLMSVGALQVLVQARLTPPAVGLASYGDLPFSALAPDGIIVVQLPAYHLGEMAAKLLLERINGDTQPTRTVVVRNTLGTPGAAIEPLH